MLRWGEETGSGRTWGEEGAKGEGAAMEGKACGIQGAPRQWPLPRVAASAAATWGQASRCLPSERPRASGQQRCGKEMAASGEGLERAARGSDGVVGPRARSLKEAREGMVWRARRQGIRLHNMLGPRSADGVARKPSQHPGWAGWWGLGTKLTQLVRWGKCLLLAAGWVARAASKLLGGSRMASKGRPLRDLFLYALPPHRVFSFLAISHAPSSIRASVHSPAPPPIIPRRLPCPAS